MGQRRHVDTLDQRRLVHGASCRSGCFRAARLASGPGSNHPPTGRAHAARATQAQTGRADKSLVIAVTDTVRQAAPPHLPWTARLVSESTEPQASALRARCAASRRHTAPAGPDALRSTCEQEAPKSSWLHTMQSNTPKPQDAALRRNLDGLLDPEADASDRDAKFAQFAVRRTTRAALQRRADNSKCRNPSTTASAASLRWPSRRMR